MRRTVKLDLDYKILHTSGEKVVKPVKMTERFIQNELDCIDDLDAFIEDNNVQDLDEIDEAAVSLNEFEKIVVIYNECHTELKLALGDKYQGAYGGRAYTANSRRYIRDLKIRSKELRKLERAIADVNLSCDKFRMAHVDLAAILGDRYNEGQRPKLKLLILKI